MRLLYVLALAAVTACSSNDATTGGAPPDASANDASAPGPDSAAPPSDGGGSDAGSSSDASPDAGPGGPTVGGCPVFAADYAYNQDISQVPVDPGSATYIANLVARAGVIDAPTSPSEFVNVVPATQADVTVGFASGGGEWGFDTSGAFHYSGGTSAQAPIPSGVTYENQGTPNADHHMIVVESGSCRLFELYAYNPTSATAGWEALVTWNLGQNEVLPDGWGSTTAAGTPIVAGLIRYDEVAAGEIRHALDIVIPGADLAQYEYVRPAARSAGACGNPYPADGFPYGGRLRLKTSYDTSGFTGTQALAIAHALQTYGMINTDDSGYDRADFRLGPGTWNTSDLSQLKLTWSDFEVPTMTVVTSKACN